MNIEKINDLTIDEFKSALRTYAFLNRVMFWNKRRRNLGNLLFDALEWIEVLENKIVSSQSDMVNITKPVVPSDAQISYGLFDPRHTDKSHPLPFDKSGLSYDYWG